MQLVATLSSIVMLAGLAATGLRSLEPVPGGPSFG